MLRVGLIGCGGIGAVHAACWLTMKEKVRLTAIADVDIQRAGKYAQECGAAVYTDGNTLLEKEELDVVDICVPSFLHTEYVKCAMAKVRNIIVEKPLCLKKEELDQLLEEQKKTGAFVQVGHVVRFTDAYRYLKETVDSNIYGKVIAGKFARISPQPVWMKGYDDRDRTGTMTLDMHIHDTDFVRYLMNGDPDTLAVQSVKDADGIVQHIWTTYRYRTACLIAEGSWDYPVEFPFLQTFCVRLEKAAIVLDESGKLIVYPDEGERYVPEIGEKQEMDMGINVSDMGPYLKELNYFADVILLGEQKSIAALEEAAASLRLVLLELELAEKNGKKN